MHYTVQEGKTRRNGSRQAIVEAATGLFLERGYGAVSMDELAEAAGVARRTLYNQFTSKEEIFREMLLKVSGQLEGAFPPGIETQGDVEDVLRLIARAILDLHKQPEYLGFLRMVAADSRQFPWIAEAFAALSRPYDRHWRPGLPQPNPGGTSVYGHPQRVHALALDVGSQRRLRSRQGGDRRYDPDVLAALSSL
jgi:AcrR family transcriptional regulator